MGRQHLQDKLQQPCDPERNTAENQQRFQFKWIFKTNLQCIIDNLLCFMYIYILKKATKKKSNSPLQDSKVKSTERKQTYPD